MSQSETATVRFQPDATLTRRKRPAPMTRDEIIEILCDEESDPAPMITPNKHALLMELLSVYIADANAKVHYIRGKVRDWKPLMVAIRRAKDVLADIERYGVSELHLLMDD
jgi:hypothetical protein